MKKKILLLAVVLMSLRLTAFCQGGDQLTTAVTNLKSLLTDHMIEKAYLHFDRPYACYVAGEIVYFKAYVFMGEKHEPSTISNVLHVDLINNSNAIVKSIALQLQAGTGWGDFALPDTLPKGSYRVRAYTNWMRNDKNARYFEQNLSVSSANSAGRVSESTAQGLKPDLQFFPEGGNIVAEVPTKVAFKAIGTNGLGMDVKGVITDNEHKEVAKFASAHLGMGEFSFIPELGKTYQAAVTFGNGAQATLSLPAVQQKGLTLAVNTGDPSKISITIRANRPYFKDNVNKKLELLIYSGGSLKHYSPVMDNSILGLDLPAAGFATGIVKITVLDGNGQPLNERLCFVQNTDLLNISLSGSKETYAPGENVLLGLAARDKGGNLVNGSFSVSVIDESKLLVDEDSENTLPSYLLLTSELKGRIEKPNFYFNHVNAETRADLDVLMLTQGYRRFDWKEMEQTNMATITNTFTAEKQMDISGSLKTKSGDPVINTTVTLIPEGGNAGAPIVQTTDNAGKFRFSGVYVAAGAKFILQAKGSQRRNMVLDLDKDPEGPAITATNPLDSKYNASADILASLQNTTGQGAIMASNNATAVMASNARANLSAGPTTANYRSSNIGGPGHADRVVFGDQFRDVPTLSQGLQALIPQVLYSNGVPYMNSGVTVTKSSQGANPMVVIIDGTNMGVGYNIDLITPSTIETVELVSGANASVYGTDGGAGVLVLTSRLTYGNNQPISKEMSPGIFSIQPTGFYKAREFYVPKYEAQHNRTDNSTTVFWKPDLITDSGGNISFNFTNTGSKGTYRVEIQGADSKGNLGMQVLRYKVQ